jgi:Recombination endonuclease VII
MTAIPRSKIPGVIWDKQAKRWKAYLWKNGRRMYLGSRSNLKEVETLRLNALRGVLPTPAEKMTILFDKMARIRTRSVWRDLPKNHKWDSFEHLLATVGVRPKGKRLVAKSKRRPIGPNNCEWVDILFDHSTREGRRAWHKVHYTANKDFYRDMQLRKKFDISLQDYNKMLERQNNACAICGKPEWRKRKGEIVSLAVDHDHLTNKNRGLLCITCNHGIGSLQDDPELLLKAARYVTKWRKRHVKGETNVIRLSDRRKAS